MSHELYKKHRPKKLSSIVGQDESVTMLQTYLDKRKVPHTILFHGPSGCGKTTFARILRRELKCGSADFWEINGADFRGIDTVRDIRSKIGLSPINGACRIVYIDECHQLSNQAQNALLKLLEDTPSHVYFLLATTDPQKVIRTIRTRCCEIPVKLLTTQQSTQLIKSVAKREGIKLHSKVISKITEAASGSARKCLVFLDSIQGLTSSTKQCDAIEQADESKQAIDLVRLLMNKSTKWPQVSAVIKNINCEPEQFRHLVLAYASNVMLSNNNVGRAALVLDAFRDNFYDSKKAGLISACYEVLRTD